MTDEPLTYEYLLEFARARQHRSSPTYDFESCPRCSHKWHGLPCETCSCPSAVPTLLGEAS